MSTRPQLPVQVSHAHVVMLRVNLHLLVISARNMTHRPRVAMTICSQHVIVPEISCVILVEECPYLGVPLQAGRGGQHRTPSTRIGVFGIREVSGSSQIRKIFVAPRWMIFVFGSSNLTCPRIDPAMKDAHSVESLTLSKVLLPLSVQ